MSCEFSRTGRACGEVVRGWHGRDICGLCLGWWRDGIDDPNIAPINAVQAMRLFETMANRPNEMTYGEYLQEVARVQALHPDWRQGQTLFNVLSRYRPDLGEQVLCGPLDPFNRDSVVEEFCTWVCENW